MPDYQNGPRIGPLLTVYQKSIFRPTMLPTQPGCLDTVSSVIGINTDRTRKHKINITAGGAMRHLLWFVICLVSGSRTSSHLLFASFLTRVVKDFLEDDLAGCWLGYSDRLKKVRWYRYISGQSAG